MGAGAISAAPPSIPALPAASGFGKVTNDPAAAGGVEQIAMGTTANDLITQYGGTGKTTEIASGGGGNDWILQSCGGTSCTLNANVGDGDSTVYQFATGSGSSTQTATGGTSGIQTFIQVGGQGTNAMSVDDSANSSHAANVGSAHIEQYGGPAGNTMTVTGSQCDDLIAIYGGGGNDAITYNMTNGSDTVIINGGGGLDSLTVNTDGLTDYTIKRASGNVLFSPRSGRHHHHRGQYSNHHRARSDRQACL